ncbi:HNH endonuclease [Lysinibacillus capsici]|uniref:HNH endonuclease n=1 Tax=Lysinibacillus capsici TaxID=2115968 RepID=UPI0038134AC9
MANWAKVKEDVLYKCKRYCSYCETYKGRDIEIHHIVQKADGGEDSFDNAIPLCFDCHSEIGSYNPNHPKGNRFRPNELKKIRDTFYNKVEKLPRKPNVLLDDDKRLLQQFKEDYTDIIEYCVRTDFSSELVKANLADKITNLNIDKWSKKSNRFQNMNLEELKDDILEKLNELCEYISDEYLKLHEPSGNLIFKNSTWEEGCKLREVLQPNSTRIRNELNELLNRLYSL